MARASNLPEIQRLQGNIEALDYLLHVVADQSQVLAGGFQEGPPPLEPFMEPDSSVGIED